jgi:hypothetical protein
MNPDPPRSRLALPPGASRSSRIGTVTPASVGSKHGTRSPPCVVFRRSTWSVSGAMCGAVGGPFSDQVLPATCSSVARTCEGRSSCQPTGFRLLAAGSGGDDLAARPARRWRPGGRSVGAGVPDRRATLNGSRSFTITSAATSRRTARHRTRVRLGTRMAAASQDVDLTRGRPGPPGVSWPTVRHAPTAVDGGRTAGVSGTDVDSA